MGNYVGFSITLVCFLLFCAPPPPPFLITPLHNNAEVGKETREKSITITHDDVEIVVSHLEKDELHNYSVMVKPLSRANMNLLFKDGYVNYAQEDNEEARGMLNRYHNRPAPKYYDLFGKNIFESGWEINPYLTKHKRLFVFKVLITNRTKGKIGIIPSESVIVDNKGEQHDVIQKEDWRGFFPLYMHPGYITLAYGSHNRYIHYYVPRNELIKREIVDETILDDKKIYPGVTIEGLLVFPKLHKSVTSFKIVVPEISYYDTQNTMTQKKDFDFEFVIKHHTDDEV